MLRTHCPPHPFFSPPLPRLLERYLGSHGVDLAVLLKNVADKADALVRFRHRRRCGVLLMDASGAVGLDLSLASAVFLMEPLKDAALEEQVRPCRAGCAGVGGGCAVVGGGQLWEEACRERPVAAPACCNVR